jgi:hypothetical protein
MRIRRPYALASLHLLLRLDQRRLPLTQRRASFWDPQARYRAFWRIRARFFGGTEGRPLRGNGIK